MSLFTAVSHSLTQRLQCKTAPRPVGACVTRRRALGTGACRDSSDTAAKTLILKKNSRRVCYILPVMVIKLYKMDPSPPARACMIACELFNVPVEMVDVNLLEEGHLKPEYLKKNPLHTVPVLEDGDLIIHDSHAILMYLADMYGKQDSLYPKDPKQRCQVNQKLLYNATILFPRLRNMLLVENSKDIEESYGFTEEFLSRTKYLAGNNITIADIAAYVTVISHENLVALNEQKFPKTLAWLKELGQLPYIQKHNTKGAEMLKQMIASKRV